MTALFGNVSRALAAAGLAAMLAMPASAAMSDSTRAHSRRLRSLIRPSSGVERMPPGKSSGRNVSARR